MDPIEPVRAFAEASHLEEKWSSARQMMSSKAKPNGEQFYSFLMQGFEGLGHIAESGDDSSRLVAIDLLVRIPASMKNNKRVQAMASDVRRMSLSLPLPPLSIISEKKSLPGSAKPAEVRENVAEALKDASGSWVLPYVFRALGDEDRSQRCRLALAREIAAQEPSIDSWFERLLEEPGLCDTSGRDLEIAAGRLKDVCEALVEGIRSRRSRLNVTPRSGQLLAKLIRMMVSLGPQQKRPKGSDLAARAAIELLDEILAVRLTVMDEPDLYDLVQVVHRWWAPRPFPDNVNEAMEPIIDKLTAGLVFRARGGQRSEAVLQRLKQAINNEELYKGRIQEIVESETGLLGEIQDWIRGMERGTSRQRSSSALSAVGAESFVQQLAELFRLTLDKALLQAQIVADTLGEEWATLTTHRAKSVLDAVKKQDVSKLEPILAHHASIREPVAAGATQFEDFVDASASPKAKRLMLVIDAGAGTTDFALFQSFYDEKTESSSLALISSAVRMSRVAGNRFDHALRPMLLRACNVQPENGSPWNAEDFAIIKADLDSQIRALKRQLFTVGSVSISLRPGASGLLTLADVVSETSYLELGKELQAQRDGLLEGAFTEDNIQKYQEATRALGRPVPIHVLLTGGSSKLPIVADLADGESVIRGIRFKFEKIDELPQWIDALPRDLAEMTAQEFSQCAVAIGGCAPQLPNERKDLFAPVTSHVQQGKWVLNRYQVRGI